MEHAVGVASGEVPRKPLSVKFVEGLGWLYVGLSLIPFLALLRFVLSGRVTGDIFMGCLLGTCVVAVPLGMASSLMKGRTAWFVWPNAMVWLIVFSAVAMGISTHPVVDMLHSAAVLLVLLALCVGPIILLSRPSAKAWLEWRRGGALNPQGCALTLCILIFVLISGGVLPFLACTPQETRKIHKHIVPMRMFAERLNIRLLSGEFDPKRFANSAELVRAVYDDPDEMRNELGAFTNVWCVSVNPPLREDFPVLFTANMNPEDLFNSRKDGLARKWKCPQEWGGECLGFCGKAGVVVRRSGAAQVMRAKSNHVLLPDAALSFKDTYFLTPTGRTASVAELAGASD